MKKFLAFLLALCMVVSMAACTKPATAPETTAAAAETTAAPAETTEAPTTAAPETEAPTEAAPVLHQRLEHPDWAEDVKAGINDMLDAYGIDSEEYKEDTYAVFDFDNTCSIFDVEEQLAIYQLQVMAFEIEPEKLADVLFTEIGDHDEDRTDLGYGKGSYADWVADITKAYEYLYTTYGPFTAKGLSEADQKTVQADPQWAEFATKMRAMYDLVYDAESASVAYPWVLYWFTGMTEQEVYDLATGSHSFYKEVETTTEHWESPADIESKVGVVTYDWTSGTQVSENIKELWSTLQDNGIDVWVCSASATDPIRAAIDVWGLHDYCTGMLAMTNVLDEDGKYVNAYDYENGCGWYAKPNGEWEKMTVPEMAQTQGVGKVEAITNAIAPEYNHHGPIAGFMDSTGDYNFCTEFDTLKAVICFNRASRKVTDGGGVIAEVAMYEKDTLGYTFMDADAVGDTLYLLQGREENGLRGLRPSNYTMTLGATEEKLFKNEDNEAQLQYMIDNLMTVEDAINTFAMKTAADDEENVLGFKYGFLKEYGGYHMHPGRYQRLENADWAEDVKAGINDMLDAYGIGSKDYKKDTYAVFDFDNTCSIFDVEEQLAVYQLQVMAFEIKPDELADVLFTEIGDHDEDRTDLGYGNGSYADWVEDITTAYKYLYNNYGPFTAKGLTEEAQAKIQADPQWAEFATKMRAMYDLVYDAESASVAYPWVLYWFTGMNEQEVYDLAFASHSFYKEVETTTEHWESPADIESKVGVVTYDWTSGTQVSENIKELWSTLQDNGIDVWVCSASATDPIRAAIDVWGLHDYCTGMLAMTNVLDKNGEYVNAYDYENGCGWYAKADGAWEKMTRPERAQTQGVGKVEAITNAIAPEYNNHGPIAGFMDSTGDYNFCTEFDTLKAVICFNRASRKVTDGGGVIAEVAMYEKDTLGYDFAKADEAGDTLYLLQGREENGLRGLRPSNYTMTLGATEEKLFKNEDNEAQLQYMIDNKMTVEDAINTFAMKTAADAEGNVLGFKYGFLKEYGGYHKHPGRHQRLEHEDWAEDVQIAMNDMIATYGLDGDKYQEDTYAVFDFDNTCSIFDVEEQLAVYQLQVMAFEIEPEKLADVLFTEIGDHDEDRTDLGYGNGSYADWVEDITKAYEYLYTTYGPFTAKGLSEADQAKVQADPQWAEFATKMRAMYDLVYDAESASVAYPWVLYWFTGMTEQEVYDLATGSHSFYKEVETTTEHWESPADIESKVGVVTYDWTSGTQVSENIKELWSTLQDNGIDVWVCSASATDPIRAAIDVWGLHDYCTGMLAMTNELDADGKYVNAYDYKNGCGWYAKADGEWEKMERPEKAQTQGVGKVEAITNAIAPEYNNHGPIAGFMDSTGDYNFCTEFETLKAVICFNRASRKVTDGGGVISEVALYERDTLGYEFADADAAGDTMYLLQGREENGLRGLRPSNYTMTLGATEEKLFKNEDNEAQLQYMIDNEMTVEDAINTFAMKTAADEEGNELGFKYGFLKEYGGYHKHK